MASDSTGMRRWLVMAGMWRSNILPVHLYLGSRVQTQVIKSVSTLCRTMYLLRKGYPTLPKHTYTGLCRPHWRTWASVLFDWLASYAEELTYSIAHSTLLSSVHQRPSPVPLPHSFLIPLSCYVSPRHVCI